MKNEGNISLTFKLQAKNNDGAAEETRPVVSIEPSSGVLAVGDAEAVKVTFCPEALTNYEYIFSLTYDFRSISAFIRGIGGRAILQTLSVTNAGNLGVDFHLRPIGAPRSWEHEKLLLLGDNENAESGTSAWQDDLKASGFRLVNPDGHCKPYSKTDLLLEYEPLTEALISTRLRLYFGEDSEDIELRGRASVPQLSIYSSSNELLTGMADVATVDLGVHPVNSEYIHTLQMANEGPFGIDFLVQPVGIREFDVFPLRGFIEPDSAAPLKIFFRPNSENRYQMALKVLWEREPLKLGLSGSGGIGKLEIGYLDEKDSAMKGLDFGMVPFNSASEKRFFLHNIGLVPVTIRADVDHDEYAITQIGEPFSNQKQTGVSRPANKRTVWNWHSELQALIPATMGIEFAARFIARTPALSAASITIKSECRDFTIPMKGKGGTIAIGHKGELGFGDIASNFTYQRKLVITNNGSIPSVLNLEWVVVGHTGEPPSAIVKLSESYSALDPRSGWARTTLLKERGLTDFTVKLGAKDYWRLIAKMIKKADVSNEGDTSKTWGIRGIASRELSHGGALNFSNESNISMAAAADSLTGGATGLIGAAGVETRSRIDWPTSRVSLFPGQTYNLAIVFNPHEESPAPGRLVIGTNNESWEIELIGLGREAVLIVSKVALEFTECLIGNSYERKLGLKNVGDVNYPVTFKLEKEFPDLEFIPASLVINPFSESYVIVSYTPTRETKSTVVMTISSPYSIHKVPVLLHAGTAILEFSTEELDFGMFERVSRPTVKLVVKNTGTVKTSYSVRDMAKPSLFQIANAKNNLLPGRSAEVSVTHIKHEVCQFMERLIVRSDLIDKFYYIRVKGQCEEALLKPEEFSILSLGICPVLESTTKTLSFTNYGRYPLEFSIKSAYPLKVTPTFGVVAGGEHSVVSVTWYPSGGYELRTQLTIVTNIGNFNVIVRGKAAFPELSIRNMYIDFGVCAVSHTYTERFTLTNKGRVPLHFNIPPLREPCYTVSTSQGYLLVNQNTEIDVNFRPSSIGRFVNSFIVECKGINYKEIVLEGIGGQMKLDIVPSKADIGENIVTPANYFNSDRAVTMRFTRFTRDHADQQWRRDASC
ncbi:hypothetical protein HK101_004834 [Irineochytrium annulatum]|nr:hypothetical protein HK101_004834 [Irineochytrium annulatum]